MSISTVALSDTFDVWRIRTNESITDLNNATDLNTVNELVRRSSAGAISVTSINVSNITLTNELTLSGALNSTNTTESTDVNSGAIYTDGGIGIAKRLNVGGNSVFAGTIACSDSTESLSTGTGSVTLSGGLGVVGNINSGGIFGITPTSTIQIPSGGSADIPGTLSTGMIRYDTDRDRFEFYNERYSTFETTVELEDIDQDTRVIVYDNPDNGSDTTNDEIHFFTGNNGITPGTTPRMKVHANGYIVIGGNGNADALVKIDGTANVTGNMKHTGTTFDTTANVTIYSPQDTGYVHITSQNSTFSIDNLSLGVNSSSTTASVGTWTHTGSASVSGDFTIGGNLTINGDTVTIDTSTLAVEDNLIALNKNIGAIDNVNDVGLHFERGTLSDLFIGWDESADEYVTATTSSNANTTGNMVITDYVNFHAGAGTFDDGLTAYGGDGVAKYYFPSTGSSRINSTIEIADYIKHYGDTDNYMGFSAADTQVFYTGGTKQLEISTTTITMNLSASTRSMLPSTTNVYDLGSSSLSYNNGYIRYLTGVSFSGVSTTAKYADLAERYESDTKYDVGTVLVLGGDKEVTSCTKKHDHRVAGVVSENPAHLMNAEAGDNDTHPPVALKGRVMCKVIGPVKKGDLLVTSENNGCAIVDNSVNCFIVGKSLVDDDRCDERLIEIKI